MKILYIHQYFVTPDEHGASRSYWFAKKLVEKGYEVTMLTATNEYKHPKGCKEKIDGIDVIYVHNQYSQYYSKIKKIYSFVKFIFQTINQCRSIRNVDLVYATSTPLTVGYIALLLRRIKGWKYVFEVRDLWPEFPIQVGAINNKLLIAFLRRIEKKIYKRSEHVVALSPGMKDGVVACGVPDEKVTVITNMSKGELFYPRTRSDETYIKYGIDKTKYNVIHAGSMGVANGLMYIMETAKLLKEEFHNETINFLLLGEGATKPQLLEYALNNRLDNVKFLGEYNTYDTSEILNCSDASVVCFMDLPILGTNSPNKMFDSLSAGKPIIVNSKGWTKKLVEDENCGFYVDPQKPKDFATKLLSLSLDPERQITYSDNARRLSLAEFDKSILTERFIEVVNDSIKQQQKNV